METTTISTACYCPHNGVVVVRSSRHGTPAPAPTAPVPALVSGFPRSAMRITSRPRRPIATNCGVSVPGVGPEWREESRELYLCSGRCEMREINSIDNGKSRQFGASSSRIRRGLRVSVKCNKMHVPGFGEKSPEAKAADNLHNFFTYIAVKIVLAQTQHYNREGYEDLMDFVNRVSLKDGDKFCAALMRESFRHKQLALRIMEVRSAYARMDFEWDNLKKLCNKHVEQSNTRLMRDFLVETSEFNE